MKNNKMVSFLNYLLNRDEFDKRSNYIEIERYLNYSLDRDTLSNEEAEFASYILGLSTFRKGRIENFNKIYDEFASKNKYNLEK